MELSGLLLGNRYELLSLLAGGGMGQVWRARDTLLRRAVAVKVLRAEVSSDPSFLARFRAEAQHAAGLTHPNIAAVFDYGEVPDQSGEHRAYLVMELVEGEPLSALLDREGRLAAPLALSILRQIAAALAVAHAAGVVHRDVKPANVLVARDGLVKITDFGIASSAASAPLTRTGQVMGTAHYLSPEQAQGERASPASDVYAAGAVAYECLAGRRPFDGDNPVQIIARHIREVPAPLPPDVPPPVRGLVERAMAKDPAQRLADGAALRAAVEAVMGQVLAGPDGRLPVTTTVPLPVPERKRPAPATAVLAAPAAAGGAVAAAGVQGRTAVLAEPADDAATPAKQRGARGLVVAVAAVALVLLVAVVAGVLHATSGSSGAGNAARSSSPGSSTNTAAPPPGIHLAAAQVTGRQIGAVKAQLIALGLRVRPVPVTTASAPAGQVVAVDPVGELSPGETVTIGYAVTPPTPTPTPTPTPKPTPKPEHHGHGHGHDKGGDD